MRPAQPSCRRPPLNVPLGLLAISGVSAFEGSTPFAILTGILGVFLAVQSQRVKCGVGRARGRGGGHGIGHTQLRCAIQTAALTRLLDTVAAKALLLLPLRRAAHCDPRCSAPLPPPPPLHPPLAPRLQVCV